MGLATLAFAQTASDAALPQGQGSFLVLFPMYLIIFVVFYFFLIRPQQKQQKEKQDMIGQLKKNDEVVTAGGIHGTVVNIKDKTVVLKVDDNVKIELDKSAVATVTKSRQSA
ncbi:MAG: preprotein translocase subunit YajC [Candidatus Omnitrophica bacterium]|nr:preprotein translocase subunit YajC [Candidatus Omnitrophota bacterium]